MSCWTQGSGSENSFQLFINSNNKDQHADITDIGWNKWHQTIIKDIKIENGQCQIGVKFNGKAGNWGSIDNIELYRQN